MSSEGPVAAQRSPAVRVHGLGKRYTLHATPWQRVRGALLGHEPEEAQAMWALRGISFEVARGESFGIVGRNGCGKSTLLELVAGTLEPTEGRVEVAGQLAALLELGAGFDPELTGRENVFVQGALLGLSRAEVEARFEDVAAFAELGSYLEEPVRHYSTGMFVRLAFAVAISVTPDVLVIDEALAVGDEAFQRRCYARIEELKAQGVTLLFVSHSAAAVLELCDRAMLLDAGEMLCVGSPRDVLPRYHRLIYAPPGRQPAIREEIVAGARGVASPGDRLPEPDEGDGAPRPAFLEDERFDEGLESKSRVEYASRGATIEDVRIETEDGRRVNVLHRGSVYDYAFRVRFDREASGVRFGMMIKNLVGSDLGGLADASPDAPGRSVSPGEVCDVRIPFRLRLNPGSYFANAGVVARESGEELFLHRILDVIAFRVVPESGLRATGTVDLSPDDGSAAPGVVAVGEARVSGA
jgi:lipopolysaccharide transport system ATP-binding protein